MPHILDFQKKAPTNNEEFFAILQDLAEKMKFMHLNNVAIMRKLVDKNIFTIDEIVEMTHEQFANDNFIVLINIAEKEFVEKYNAGIKITYNKSLWHKIKDWFTGAPDLEIEIKQDENANKNDSNS